MPKALPVIDMSAPVCCCSVGDGPLGESDALGVALRLKALADPTRVRLMSMLLAQPATTGALAECVGLTEATVSHHLAQLRTAGFIESTRNGMNVLHTARAESLTALCAVLTPNCC